MLRYLITCVSIAAISLSLYATDFAFNERCQKAYNHIFNLQFNKAEKLISQEKQENQDNLIPILLDNYLDFLTIYISEDEETYFTRLPQKRKRIKVIQKGNDESPYYLYSQAEIHLHWAIAGLKFEQYLNAFKGVKRAYELLQLNQDRFPDFMPNHKSLGVLHAAIGAIPDKYKWGVNLLGMDGSIDQGMMELQSVLQSDERDYGIFKQEATILYAFLLLHLRKDNKEAWQVVSSEEMPVDESLLNCFVKCSVAMYTGRNDEAISILEKKPMGAEYYPFHFLDYMMGLAKARRMDHDANAYLISFVNEFKGNNYIKESYQKLAWISLINGDEVAYLDHMQKCISEGEAIIDADIAAEYEAYNYEPPQPLLLRSRLLFDGGYYEKAIKLLDGKTVEDFDRENDRIEFTYRAGRILDEWGEKDESIGYYYATIKNTKKQINHFAPNSALKLGKIYEDKMNLEKAHYFYKKCLSYKGHIYKSGIDAQAKAGLNRIKQLKP